MLWDNINGFAKQLKLFYKVEQMLFKSEFLISSTPANPVHKSRDIYFIDTSTVFHDLY